MAFEGGSPYIVQAGPHVAFLFILPVLELHMLKPVCERDICIDVVDVKEHRFCVYPKKN